MSAARLVPRWWTSVVLVLLVVAVGAGAVGLFAADGLLRATLVALGLAGLLFLVAAVRSLLLPRRRRDLRVDADGATVIESPATIVWPLVTGWLLLHLAALGLGGLLIVDFDSVESPGAAGVAAVGGLIALPETFRLLTGRLHRWRLTLGPEGYTYAGYRTVETVSWSKVHGASLQRGKDAGVVIDRKGTGPDRVVPIMAFDVAAEQIVEEIETRIGRRRA